MILVIELITSGRSSAVWQAWLSEEISASGSMPSALWLTMGLRACARPAERITIGRRFRREGRPEFLTVLMPLGQCVPRSDAVPPANSIPAWTAAEVWPSLTTLRI